MAAFEFEGDVLQGDEAFAGLGAGVIEIVQVGGGGLHASLDGFDVFLSDLILEFGDVAGGLHLSDGALQTQGFFGDLVAGGFGLFCSFEGFRFGLLHASVLSIVKERKVNGHTDGGVVGLEVFVVRVVVVVGGEVGVLGGKIDTRPQRLALSFYPKVLRSGVFYGGLHHGVRVRAFD